MNYKTVYTEVEVDVDISEFDTEDLIDELESRGEIVGSDQSGELVRYIYEQRRMGRDYQQALDDLIYQVIGRFV
jgi:hypothetical protein